MAHFPRCGCPLICVPVSSDSPSHGISLPRGSAYHTENDVQLSIFLRLLFFLWRLANSLKCDWPLFCAPVFRMLCHVVRFVPKTYFCLTCLTENDVQLSNSLWLLICFGAWGISSNVTHLFCVSVFRILCHMSYDLYRRHVFALWFVLHPTGNDVQLSVFLRWLQILWWQTLRFFFHACHHEACGLSYLRENDVNLSILSWWLKFWADFIEHLILKVCCRWIFNSQKGGLDVIGT